MCVQIMRETWPTYVIFWNEGYERSLVGTHIPIYYFFHSTFQPKIPRSVKDMPRKQMYEQGW